MYTFIGRPLNSKEFKTIDGYIITFDKPISLFDDTMYVILCDRNPVTRLFTFIKSHYWWGPVPED